jgi:hypothetical protein
MDVLSMSEDLEAIRVMGFWYWAWCRTGCYRAFMRLVHRFNWHHCTVMGPFEDGETQHWCQWCGLRYVIPKPSYPLGFPNSGEGKHGA